MEWVGEGRQAPADLGKQGKGHLWESRDLVMDLDNGTIDSVQRSCVLVERLLDLLGV